MFKIGVVELNSRVMLKAKERMDKIEKKEKKKKEEMNRQKEEDKNLSAILCWLSWAKKGLKVDEKGDQVLYIKTIYFEPFQRFWLRWGKQLLARSAKMSLGI